MARFAVGLGRKYNRFIAPLHGGEYSGNNTVMEKEKLPPQTTTEPKLPKPETGGPKGPEPTRYNDWEIGGKCVDF